MRIQHDRIVKPSPDGLELFMARSGRLSARINRNGSYLHLHSAIRPEAEADHFAGIEFWGDLVVFLGMGLGYHVAPYLKDIPSGTRILVIDYHPRCIGHCCEKLFGSASQDIIAVSNTTPDLERVLRDASATARYIQVIRHPASYHAHRDFYEAALESIRFKRVRASEAGGPLLFSGSFFLEQEIERALASRGRPPALFRYKELDDAVRFESALLKAIQERRPRYILSVNMKGFDANGIVRDVSKRLGVPVIIWFVDDPHPIMLAQHGLVDGSMYAFSWERSYLPWLAGQGFGAANYLPLAGDPSLFHAARDTLITAELGFVGSSMGSAFLADLAARFLWKPALEPLVAAAAQRLLAQRAIPLPRLVAETCAAQGIPVPFADDRNRTWLSSYIIHTASMLRRRELVGACIPSGIETFGDPEGWRELFGNTIRTHTDVDYTTGLATIYSSTAINLNITSCQMPAAVNQRVFDIPLCNGFVLSDDQSDLHELFAPDEIATYASRDDLLHKIARYRAHPEERARIAQKSRAAVLASHTYAHRLETLEKILR